MKRDSRVVSRPSCPILIVDVLVFVLFLFTIGFVDVCMIRRQANPIFSQGMSDGITIALFIVTLLLYVFYLFIEYKFNRLKFRNIFLYLGIALAFINFISVISLPSEMSLPNDTSIVITPIMKTYYIFSGCFFALIPYLCFYLIPRKITSRHYLDIFLYVIIGFALLAIIISFITDWQHYLNIFKTFDLDNNAICSFFFEKGSFAFALLAGIFASIFLRIRQRKWQWILMVIPLYIFLILTSAKMAMLMATVIILVYVIIQLVLVCKKSRDNLIITLMVVGLCLLISPLLIIGIIRSESGILAGIRENLINLIEHAKVTIASRELMWESTFKLLSSWRVICGYGVNSFGLIFHQVYVQVAPAFDQFMYTPHNFVVELLGDGGIILLGTYLFINGYLIYAALKIRKHNHWLVVANLIFLGAFTLICLFVPGWLCGSFIDAIPSLVIILPIMSEYYILIDKDEKAIRKDIVNQSKQIKKVNYKNKLLELNKKRLLNEAKYIAYDLNSKIRL